VIEDLPTLRDVLIAVRLPEKVARAHLVPGGQKLALNGATGSSASWSPS